MDEKEYNKVYAVAERPDDLAGLKYAESEDRCARIVPVETATEKQKIIVVGADTIANLSALRNAVHEKEAREMNGGIRPSDRISVIGARTPLSRSLLFGALGKTLSGAIGMNLFEDARGREVIPIIEDMHHSTIRPNDHMVGDRVVRSACDIYAPRDTTGAADRRAKRKTQKKARKASRRK